MSDRNSSSNYGCGVPIGAILIAYAIYCTFFEHECFWASWFS